ncbi:hypothetical protein GPL17_15740 [Bradyrhizobium yuanmingense]|uniref:hypothetical protein n=1 Tax=Bradyrhizobium TaxID=374 RepID=UPI0012FA69FA|nr:hypothetical protein [Bradyrhizobium yuanmingense]MDF0497721.1 hypothetical protein [Bradyrhizobium yuanmingense]MVT51940.1 hypothetical protein [Bradyrhizobium yuanmingense]
MPKTLVEFRAQNLRLLERLCPDDPRYIAAWLKQFDEQNGITPKAGPKSGKRRARPSPRSKTASAERMRSAPSSSVSPR